MRVHYLEAGKGDPLLLVHGLLTDHRAWRLLVPLLSPHFRVIVPDLPGFGASEKPTRYAFTREAFAETLCDLLAGVEVTSAHVVGAGLGGTVAMTLAADHPECVERLAVLSSVAYPTPKPLRSRLAETAVVGALLFKQFTTRGRFHALLRDEFYAAGYRYDRRTVDAWFDAFDPPEARECAWLAFRRAESDLAALGPKLPKVRCPTTVLWGERDPNPMTLGMRLAYQITGARIESVPGASRALAEEQPEATAAAVLRHLRAAPAVSTSDARGGRREDGSRRR